MKIGDIYYIKKQLNASILEHNQAKLISIFYIMKKYIIIFTNPLNKKMPIYKKYP